MHGETKVVLADLGGGLGHGSSFEERGKDLVAVFEILEGLNGKSLEVILHQISACGDELNAPFVFHMSEFEVG